MNAKEFALKCGVSRGLVARWYENGYLGAATRDEKTGIYEIPENTPAPYTANPRVNRISSLYLEILKAADRSCSLFPTMYPQIPEETVIQVIDEFVSKGLIRKCTSIVGIDYYVLQSQGAIMLQKLNGEQKDKLLREIQTAIQAGSVFITILHTFFM